MQTLKVFQSLQKLPRQTRAVLLTAMYGLTAGAATVAFQLSMNALYRVGLVALAGQSLPVFLGGSFAVIMASALVVGWLLDRFCREAAGSGIPQLKLSFWKDFGHVPWRVVWVKFLAGALSIGGGSSLGREGPCVHLAGGIGSIMAGFSGEPKQNRRTAAASGAAAGLAAAFNTPLASITFVLEEIIGDLNSRFLGSVLLASVLGAMVVHGVVGRQPAFTLTGAGNPTWIGYALTPVVAALASFVGVYFQRGSISLRAAMKRQRRVPGWLIPAAGALVTWMLGVGVFWGTGRLGVFSLGYEDLSDALRGDIGWQLAGLLLLTKFIATVSCYGFNGCGGIFSPTLFLGGMVGVAVAGLVGMGWEVSRPDLITLAVVGMSACLGAVVWAPVTGILIVFEMTHEFSLVPALMVGALVSQAISRKMNRDNFYEELLEQDGHQIEHVRPPRDLQSWQQLPVSTIANFKPVIAASLEGAELNRLVETTPYARFPVVEEGTLKGIIARKEIDATRRTGGRPNLAPAITCLPTDSIRRLGMKLMESPQGITVVMDQPGGRVLGVVTLHDLLRAQVAAAERGS